MAAGNRKLALLTLLAFFLVFAGEGEGAAAAAAPFLSFNSSSSSASSSLGEHLLVSEWGLESEFGRRLLQISPRYLGYRAVNNADRSAVRPSRPGNAYSRGCQKNYYCRN
ncbi:hypothetical protein AXF42_Ash011438 [Apostasia shenzhenica]|uniref:Protein RALF-like 33 n=1 Tax=Apostasia shenzhenica TaxID=1088818 RepID=A0A2I0AEJ4_9ASPA|nr:hypothetical protein AXF42_Ash011438 [Apostasia shenzhenica]